MAKGKSKKAAEVAPAYMIEVPDWYVGTFPDVVPIIDRHHADCAYSKQVSRDDIARDFSSLVEDVFPGISLDQQEGIQMRLMDYVEGSLGSLLEGKASWNDINSPDACVDAFVYAWNNVMAELGYVQAKGFFTPKEMKKKFPVLSDDLTPVEVD